MMRQGSLTWTMAPRGYWAAVGYTPSSARRAASRWVVAEARDVARLLAAMDPGTLIRAVRAHSPGDVVAYGPVTSGPLRGDRVLVFRPVGGQVQKVFLSSGASPRLIRITSAGVSTVTTVDVLGFPHRFRVHGPQAAGR
jgi:hypothetical protein